MLALANAVYVVILLMLVFLLTFVAAALLTLVWHEGFGLAVVTLLAIAGVSFVSAIFLLMLRRSA